MKSSHLRLIGVFVASLLLLAVAAGCGEEEAREAAEEVATQAREAAEGVQTRAEELFGKAQSAVDPDHTIAITNFVCPFAEEGLPQPAPGSVLALVEIEVKNTDRADITVGPGDFKIETDDGVEHDAVVNVDVGDPLKSNITIKPGETIRRVIFFEVPEGKRAPFLVDKASVILVKLQIPGQQG